jgi:hypothetical protein
VSQLGEIREAAVGWIDLVGKRPGAAERFNGTRAGLMTMLGFYVVLVLAAHLIRAAVMFGAFPGYVSLIFELVRNALPMLAVFGVIFLTVRFLGAAVGMLALMVPAGYALSFIVALGLPLSLLGGGMYFYALQGVLGYMLYRLGRDVGKFGIGVSIGFAVLNVLVLVAIPIGLYMLLVPDIPNQA